MYLLKTVNIENFNYVKKKPHNCLLELNKKNPVLLASFPFYY